MQLSFFPEDAAPAILLTESIAGYHRRTIENAKACNLTVAIALDFTSHGERLTKKAAGANYLAVEFDSSLDSAVEALTKSFKYHGVGSLNVAGNSLATFARLRELNQPEITHWLYALLRAIPANLKPSLIRSGGQTGMDWAGLVAGIAMEIPVHGHFPLGFLRRDKTGKDFTSSEKQIREELMADVANLLRG